MIDSDRNPNASTAVSWRDKAAMIVPLVLFFLLGAGIDTSPIRDGETIHAQAYLALVVARVVLMTVAIVYFFKPILRQFPPAVDHWGWIIGVLGAAIWIGVCELELERQILEVLGISQDWLPARQGVDPFATYPQTIERVGFLMFRFSLLAVCVPIAEELFLRGFVMRAFESEDWTQLSLTQIGRNGLLVGTAYGILTHPGECIAAAIWFSLVSWMMVKTGKFWNCVIAHAVTNLILGIYVCTTDAWQLW